MFSPNNFEDDLRNVARSIGGTEDGFGIEGMTLSGGGRGQGFRLDEDEDDDDDDGYIDFGFVDPLRS